MRSRVYPDLDCKSENTCFLSSTIWQNQRSVLLFLSDVYLFKLKPQRGRSGRSGKGGSRQPKDDRTDLIEKIDMENERFFAYYKAQKIVPDEEWNVFVEALRQHLPTTFRVAGSRQYVHRCLAFGILYIDFLQNCKYSQLDD